MATIGTFKRQDDGSYAGSIKTLTLNVKQARLTPVASESGKGPDFRIFAGSTEFGAAWKKTSREEREYLSVKLDELIAPMLLRFMASDRGFMRGRGKGGAGA